MYLATDYWRKQGILDKCDVHYISGATTIFGVPEYKATLEEILKDRNIKVHYSSNVLAINGEAKSIEFETKDNANAINEKFGASAAGCYSINEESNSGDTVSKVTLNFDFCHTVPPQSAPDFIKN